MTAFGIQAKYALTLFLFFFQLGGSAGVFFLKLKRPARFQILGRWIPGVSMLAQCGKLLLILCNLFFKTFAAAIAEFSRGNALGFLFYGVFKMLDLARFPGIPGKLVKRMIRAYCRTVVVEIVGIIIRVIFDRKQVGGKAAAVVNAQAYALARKSSVVVQRLKQLHKPLSPIHADAVVVKTDAFGFHLYILLVFFPALWYDTRVADTLRICCGLPRAVFRQDQQHGEDAFLCGLIKFNLHIT